MLFHVGNPSLAVLAHSVEAIDQLLPEFGDALPQVAGSTPMTQVIYEMSRKKLGMTTVLEDGRLAGMISDGDLRRLLERGDDSLYGSRRAAPAALPRRSRR